MLKALNFNSAKCETTCRLCLGRIRLLKNKRNQQVRLYRRDIADLLRQGKQDHARIRVESVIRESLTLTAYEVLELYLELLAVRAALVASQREIPRDLVEALSSVLYAAGRLPELEELNTLHKMFAGALCCFFCACAVCCVPEHAQERHVLLLNVQVLSV